MDIQEPRALRNLEVIIDGRVYTLAGNCTEEHLQRIGRYIDKKISEARRVKPITAYNFDLSTLYIVINLVDDLLQNTDRADILEAENDRAAGEAKRLRAEADDLKKKLFEANKIIEEDKKEIARLRNESVKYAPPIPKAEAPKIETPKAEAPKAEAPKTEIPKAEPPKAETVKKV